MIKIKSPKNNSGNKKKLYLSVKEAAEYTGISEYYIRKYIKDGKILEQAPEKIQREKEPDKKYLSTLHYEVLPLRNTIYHISSTDTRLCRIHKGLVDISMCIGGSTGIFLSGLVVVDSGVESLIELLCIEGAVVLESR